jgi:SAM-dependent methyltransferase
MIKNNNNHKIKLQLLPRNSYIGVNEADPLRFYFYPVFGHYYRRRVDLCLRELKGGHRILEVGFGSGLTFLNLHKLYDEIWGIDLTCSINDIHELFIKMGIETHLQNGYVQNMPYPNGYFDSVLIISTLEHLQPSEMVLVFQEISRVLRPGGQVVYGVPVEHPLMVFLFKVLGVNIRDHHYSTEIDVANAVKHTFRVGRIKDMKVISKIGPSIYKIGAFVKDGDKDQPD